MAAIFKCNCPDCGHDWEGWSASLYVGPGPWSWANDVLSLFCPRCYNCLSLPKVLDRNRWQQWYGRFLTEPSPGPEWVLPLLAHIDAQFASSAWYRPHVIDPGLVNCSVCSLAMVPSVSGVNHVHCPKCGSLSPTLSACAGFVQIFRSEDGFS